MSAVGKPVKVQKEKFAKMNSSQNGKPEMSLANKNQVGMTPNCTGILLLYVSK